MSRAATAKGGCIDDDWEEYEANLYEYDAERLLFKRVIIVSEYDAKKNQFVRVAK
jgi:hypothetical protein